MEMPKILPLLRTDIKIDSGGNDFNGHPTWVVHDPVGGRFFHLGWKEYTVIQLWESISPESLLKKVTEKSIAEVSLEDINDIYTFLSINCLIKNDNEQLKLLFNSQHNKHSNYLGWLVKNYLFFRVPLVSPNNFLDKSYSYIKFVFTLKFFMIMVVFAIIGINLLSKQWDLFSATFSDFFSIGYLLPFCVAVIIAKTFHELGHAYMCKKHSLGVPAMGVAFLVLFPMLYTDTNESWKVKNPKQRITISLAGVMMEFYVAIFAMWLWMILPNGGFKSACFFLCTYSLIATIIINISPFLRFDGYHVLSDILSMRNLQTRSFALLKWRIRNLFFGLNIDPPECFNLAKRRFLYVYAALTWIYRFVLFIGIAFLIYYFFFKALGIILFCVEIYYFILRPIFNEVKIWWGFRDQIKINKNTICLLVMLFFLIIFLVIPWQNSISLPSTISYQKQEVFTDSAAKVSDILVKNGDIVVKDQVLLKLASPKLEFNINIVKNKIEQLKLKLRDVAVYSDNLSYDNTLRSQLNYSYNKLNHLEEKLRALTIKSPFNGIVSFISPKLYPGLWVAKNQGLVVISNNKQISTIAYATYNEYKKLEVGDSGTFIPENNSLPKIKVSLTSITNYQLSTLYKKDQNKNLSLKWVQDLPPLSAYHSSSFGGSIAIIDDKEEGLVPDVSMYRIVFKNTNALSADLNTVIRGKVFLSVYRDPIIVRVWDSLIHFIISESGF